MLLCKGTVELVHSNRGANHCSLLLLLNRALGIVLLVNHRFPCFLLFNIGLLDILEERTGTVTTGDLWITRCCRLCATIRRRLNFYENTFWSRSRVGLLDLQRWLEYSLSIICIRNWCLKQELGHEGVLKGVHLLTDDWYSHRSWVSFVKVEADWTRSVAKCSLLSLVWLGWWPLAYRPVSHFCLLWIVVMLTRVTEQVGRNFWNFLLHISSLLAQFVLLLLLFQIKLICDACPDGRWLQVLLLSSIDLDYTITVHLLINEIDDHLNCLVRGHSKILWCRVVGINQTCQCLRKEGLAPFRVLHEVEAQDVVEIGMHLVLIVKVKIIVQLCKLQYHFNGFGLVITWKATMLSAFENSVAALEDEVWADWVLLVVQALVKLFLLGEEDYCAILLGQASCGWILATFIYSSLDITPNVRRIVSIEVDDCFLCSVASFTLNNIFTVTFFCAEIARDLIEIFLVSHWANDINNFVEGHSWVFFQVGVDLVSQDAIVWNFLKLDCRHGFSVLFKERRVQFGDLLVSFRRGWIIYFLCKRRLTILLLSVVWQLKIWGLSLGFWRKTRLYRIPNVLGQSRLAHAR